MESPYRVGKKKRGEERRCSFLEAAGNGKNKVFLVDSWIVKSLASPWHVKLSSFENAIFPRESVLANARVVIDGEREEGIERKQV